MGCKELCLKCSKKFGLGCQMSWVPQSRENNDISANAKENFDYPTAGEHICRSIAAIQAATNRKE
jgi:hypothetical protein